MLCRVHVCRELREGAQREIVDRQVTKLASATLYEATKSKQQGVRMHNVKKDLKDKSDFLKAYDDRIRQLTVRSAQERDADLGRRRQLADTQRAAELESRERGEAGAYKPFTGSATTMQAKLLSLSQGMEL